MSVNISYRLTAATKSEAEDLLTRIAYEQSVELPDDVLTPEIRENVVGKVSAVNQTGDQTWDASITFPDENVGDEPSQLLNVLFGNVSMFSGVMITGVDWHSLKNGLLAGPAFGIDGIRKQLGISKKRPLSCTALKPLGLSAEELGKRCYEFAAGGIDIIKDDHGLTNQKSAPFSERLKFCTDAIRKAAEKTGRKSIYAPNITGDFTTTLQRYEQAYEAGAGMVLVCPHIIGLDVLIRLAKSEIPLPVMAHPAFSGSLVQNPVHGFTKDFLYGKLWRAFGADCAIYPNAGGRFSFTADECRAINLACRSSEIPFKPVFPTPGGGMQRETLPKLVQSYGPDTIFLIGGSLYQHPKGIRFAAAEIREVLS